MKEFEYQATCICGHEVKSFFKKPTLITPTVSTVKCDGCESKFLIKIHLKSTPRGKEFQSEVDEIELSKKAKTLAKKLLTALKEAT